MPHAAWAGLVGDPHSAACQPSQRPPAREAAEAGFQAKICKAELGQVWRSTHSLRCSRFERKTLGLMSWGCVLP
ncbi:uncharacterized [Tachysurus ichikawai]